MSLLISVIIILIILALLVWAVDMLPLGSPFNNIVKVLIIVIGVLLIAERAGLLS
jgi:hypothetical protein